MAHARWEEDIVVALQQQYVGLRGCLLHLMTAFFIGQLIRTVLSLLPVSLLALPFVAMCP